MTQQTQHSQHLQASPHTGEAFVEFCNIIDRLRAPGGCPWDIEQTHESIAADMTEEAAEAVNAIYTHDIDNMREELGDVLQQVIFHTSIASSAGEFTIDDVIEDIKAKMIRRHPHVFGAETSLLAAGFSEEEIKQATSPGAVLDMWHHIKAKEREIKEEAQRKKRLEAGLPQDIPAGLLDGVPHSLPALRQAANISKKTINVGFDWPSTEEVWKQYEDERAEFEEARADEEARAGLEERAELEEARANEKARAGVGNAHKTDAAFEEFGDMLFTLVNVAIKEHIDAEDALRFACEKFRARWALMEKYAFEEQGVAIDKIHEQDKEGLEKLWQRAKIELAQETAAKGAENDEDVAANKGAEADGCEEADEGAKAAGDAEDAEVAEANYGAETIEGVEAGKHMPNRNAPNKGAEQESDA